MTIVRNVAAYGDYPFEAISPSALQHIRVAIDNLEHISGKLKHVLSLLECFLQLVGKTISSASLRDGTCSYKLKLFAGALNSSKFLAATKFSRYDKTRALVILIEELRKEFPLIQTIQSPSSVRLNETLAELVNEFETIELDEEKVWLWKGWSSQNRNGKGFTFKLYPVYKKLGRDFTQSLFEIYDQYCQSRRSDAAPGLNFLIPFIDQYPSLSNPVQLQEPGYSGQFWHDFFHYYVTTRHANGSRARVSTIITSWRSEIGDFIRNHLIKSGLFAEPWGNLPSPPVRNVKGNRTNIKTSAEGVTVKANLLTHIPLEVSDEVAIQLLFQDIKNDLQEVKRWAVNSCESLWGRFQRRLLNARLQSVELSRSENCSYSTCKPATAPFNPNYLKNLASVFEQIGFKTRHDISVNRYYHSVSSAGYDLGLPVTGALLPYCVLLVAEHPTITQSFLEKLEIYNQDGKRTGFVKTDAGHYLVGYKDRRGPKRSQQKILLSPHSVELINQILTLTEVLRDYLKKQGDQQWRYLLLDCGHGFSYPKRVTRLSTYTSEKSCKARLVSEFTKTSKLTAERITALVENMSLKSIRASAGTCVYLETLSVDQMAKALGHSSYSSKLLEHYLPKPIINFFQERWIRIFQSGIIVEALKDSPHLIEASGFSCIENVHHFLSNHAIKALNIDQPSSELSKANNKVIFGVNSAILTALRGLQLTSENLGPKISSDAKCVYWAKISKFLFHYIENELSHRADLQMYVSIAKATAKPFKG